METKKKTASKMSNSVIAKTDGDQVGRSRCDSEERCSTPVPEDNDAWQELFEDVSEVTLIPPALGEGDESAAAAAADSAVGDGLTAPKNGVTQEKSDREIVSAPEIPGLAKTAIAVLSYYYKEGPDAPKKPQWDAFYNCLPNSNASDKGDCIFKNERYHGQDLSKFVHPESKVRKQESHDGFRGVLNESLWQTKQSHFDAEVEIEDLVQEMDIHEPQQNVQSVSGQQFEGGAKIFKHQGKIDGNSSPLPQLPAAIGKKCFLVDMDPAKLNMAQIQSALPDSRVELLCLVEPEKYDSRSSSGKQRVARDSEIGTTDKLCLKRNPVLPGHEISPSPPDISPTQLNAEIDGNRLGNQNASNLTGIPRDPEFDDWGEELDYE